MAFYKQDIVDINLNTGNIFRSFLNHSIGFKNDDADRFGIRVFRDGEPVDLTGASCQAVFINPLGTNIALTSYGTVSGNVAYVTLPQACYDYEGQFCLSIQLVGGGVTGTMRIVDGMVVNTGASGAVAPTAAVPTYQEILAVYADMQEDIADYESVVANQNDQINSLKSAFTSLKDATAYSKNLLNAYDEDLSTTDISLTVSNQKVVVSRINTINDGVDFTLYSGIVMKPGTYKVSIQNMNWTKAQSGYLGYLRIQGTGITTVQIEIGSTNNSATITVANETSLSLTVTIAKNGMYNTMSISPEFNIQIEKGSTVSTWTPYELKPVFDKDIEDIETLLGNTPLGTTAQTVTGAIAEHESDIQTLSEASEDYGDRIDIIEETDIVEYRSKNILNAYDEDLSDSNIGLTVSNQKVKCRRINTISSGKDFTLYSGIAIKSGTYTVSVQNMNWTKAQSGYLGFLRIQGTGITTAQIEIGSTSNTQTITTASDTEITLVVTIAKSGMFNTMTIEPEFNIQIEEGSSSTTWVPYSLYYEPALKNNVDKNTENIAFDEEEFDKRTREEALSANRILDESRRMESVYNYLKKIKGEGESIQIDVPEQSASVSDATIRVALHKHTQEGTSFWNEIFSEDFEEDFSNLRFVDEDNNELPFVILSHGNYDFVKDEKVRNAQAGVFKLSDNTMVTTQNNTAVYSVNNGSNWSTLGSAGVSGQVRFVDVNDNVYMQNTNYQIVKLSASSNYNTSAVVLDLSATQSNVYTKSIAQDDNGYIYMGQYQLAFNSSIYRSTDGGDTFTKVYENTNKQHVHHITINHRTNPNEIWAGLDDSTTYYGPLTIVSRDGGTTWTEVDVPFRNRDYAFSYFGNGYMLGCGEASILGGPTVYRATILSDGSYKYDVVIDTKQGVRSIVSPYEGIICVAGCGGGTNLTEQLYLSYDNCNSFFTAFMNDIENLETTDAGNGVRLFTPYFTPKGATEAQMIGAGYDRNYGLRCYFGGDRHYAIAEVNVGSVPTTGKTIYCKTGYAVTTSSIEESAKENSNLLYELTSDGEKIITTTGVVRSDNVKYEQINTVGYGETIPTKIRDYFGIILENPVMLPPLGIASLKNKTISFVLKQRKNGDTTYETQERLYIIQSEHFSLSIKGVGLYFNLNGVDSVVSLPQTFFHSNGLYTALTITITNDSLPTIKVYCGEERFLTQYQSVTVSSWSNVDLSSEELYLGSNDESRKIWDSGISSLRIYDGCFSHADIVHMMQGKHMIK